MECVLFVRRSQLNGKQWHPLRGGAENARTQDPNAISHYAKLDIEQLRFYTLTVPKATETFANVLSGRSSAR
jgi:hypothetical protein